MRYRGIKGKLWRVFSDFIRLRDYKKYGRCITCNRKKEYGELQAGHYLAAGNCGFGLLFDEENVHAECNYDNAFNQNHQIEYRKNLISRIGRDKVESLEERYRDSHYRGKVTKEWSEKIYKEKIVEYKRKKVELQKELGY